MKCTYFLRPITLGEHSSMEKNTVSSREKGYNENAVFVLVYDHIISEKKEHVTKTLN